MAERRGIGSVYNGEENEETRRRRDVGWAAPWRVALSMKMAEIVKSGDIRKKMKISGI